MELVFRGHAYDTEVASDMRALQTVLDRMDIEERVAKKKQAALLKIRDATHTPAVVLRGIAGHASSD